MRYPYLDLNMALNAATEELSNATTQIHNDAQAEDGSYWPENIKIALAEIQAAQEALDRAGVAIKADVERESKWEAEGEAMDDSQSY